MTLLHISTHAGLTLLNISSNLNLKPTTTSDTHQQNQNSSASFFPSHFKGNRFKMLTSSRACGPLEFSLVPLKGLSHPSVAVYPNTSTEVLERIGLLVMQCSTPVPQ